MTASGTTRATGCSSAVADVLRGDVRATDVRGALRAATSSCCCCPRRTSPARSGRREDPRRHRARLPCARRRAHPDVGIDRPGHVPRGRPDRGRADAPRRPGDVRGQATRTRPDRPLRPPGRRRRRLRRNSAKRTQRPRSDPPPAASSAHVATADARSGPVAAPVRLGRRRARRSPEIGPSADRSPGSVATAGRKSGSDVASPRERFPPTRRRGLWHARHPRRHPCASRRPAAGRRPDLPGGHLLRRGRRRAG